jgi:hypothetical protein
MSDSLAKLIDKGACRGDAVGKPRAPMRFSLIGAVVPALFVCNVAIAQVSGMATPTPTIGATSPLGIGTGSTVSPTGIPLGSTELVSPGISPAPTYSTGTIAMPGNGTTCSTVGTAPSGMYGSTATYDGGGMAMGTATPATAATSGMATSSGMSTSSGISATSGMSTTSGMMETSGLSGMCGSGSSSIASSSTPTSTSPTTPGGAARTGLPLGSIEIGNLGVSSAAAVPTISVFPTVGTAPLVPTMPTVTSPPAVSSTTTSTVGNTLPGSNSSGSTLAPTGPGL